MKTSVKLLIVSLAASVALGACGRFLDTQGPQLAADIPSIPDTETFAKSLGVNISTMKRTTNGVYYSDTRVGTGAQVDSAVPVVIDYAIYLKDGTFIASNQQSPLNMLQAVPGLTEGMLGSGVSGGGMREGGVRLIVVPSELGYANVGFGHIPPNATIVYNVQLDQIP